MLDDEWATAKVDMHFYEKEPALRIMTVDASDRYRITFNKPASDRLIDLEWVRIAFSKANGEFRIKLLPVKEGFDNARRLRFKNSGIRAMGGAAIMVKRYKFPVGYYYMDKDGVFTWRKS